MAKRKATGKWQGTLKEGQGTLALGSGAFEGPFSFGTRFGDEAGTNPEELVGAALAGCFSMALAAGLGKAGYEPNHIDSSATVELEKKGEGFEITRIALNTDADVPKIENDEFQRLAEETKQSCPVSKALAGPQITLEAHLKK